MSSETKSRAGLREALEKCVAWNNAHGNWSENMEDLVRAALESSSSADTGGREALPDIRPQVGNVLDHWANLPNDVRFSGDMDALNKALEQLYNAAGGFTK